MQSSHVPPGPSLPHLPSLTSCISVMYLFQLMSEHQYVIIHERPQSAFHVPSTLCAVHSVGSDKCITACIQHHSIVCVPPSTEEFPIRPSSLALRSSCEEGRQDQTRCQPGGYRSQGPLWAPQGQRQDTQLWSRIGLSPWGQSYRFIGVGRGRKARQVMLFRVSGTVPGPAVCGLLVFSKALLPGTDAGLVLGGGGARGASWRRDGSGGPSTMWPLSGHTGGKSLYPFRRQTPVASVQAPGRPALG